MNNNKERQMIFLTTEKMAKEFIAYCDKNGFSISKRLRLFIEKDMQGKLKIED